MQTMNDGAVRSPGVGKVIEILVTVGVQVATGDEVIVIESMKMEIPVTAPRAGRVAAIAVAPGDQVQADDLLLTLTV
jgi:biotin carboxyl carrier protein